MITEEQARVIAQWWAERLQDSTKYDAGCEEISDRKISDFKSIMAEAGLIRSSGSVAITACQVNVFRSVLEEIIVREQPRHLGVDYHPDRFLKAALTAARLPNFGVLPIKTNTSNLDMRGNIGYSGEWHDIGDRVSGGSSHDAT